MTRHTRQMSVSATCNAIVAMAVCGPVLVVAGFSGCASETSDERMRELAAAGDLASTESLIEGLGDESESVRRAAQRGLEDVLKRKIYFDPAAPEADRNRRLLEVRAMWQNLKDRDLFEASKKRAPIQYFYDLNRGEIFEARAGTAPIETTSGPYGTMPAGVRARVCACRDCGEDRFAAWLFVPIGELERYGIPYDAPHVEDAAGVEMEPKKSELAVRSPDGEHWVWIRAPAAEAITKAARRCPEGTALLFCRPGR